MRIETFEMERLQSVWENRVKFNLSESGVHPMSTRELISDPDFLDQLLDTPLAYNQSNGTEELRKSIAALYPGADEDNVEVTADGAALRVEAVTDTDLADEGDWLVIPSTGARLTVDEVQALRDADHRERWIGLWVERRRGADEHGGGEDRRGHDAERDPRDTSKPNEHGRLHSQDSESVRAPDRCRHHLHR